MTIKHEIHKALLHHLRHYNSSLKKKGEILFVPLPHLNELEYKFITYILFNDELRPKMYKLKKTSSYIGFENLLVPKSYKYYSHIFKNAPLYSKYKNNLIDKNVIYETSQGFIMNHKYFPFKDRNTMAHLRKYITMPLPPE